MSVLAEQFEHALDTAPSAAPWPALEASGFLDALRAEEDGGAALALEDFFPFALAVGRRPQAPNVIETMLARLADPQALDIADAEVALTAFGAGPARVLAALGAAGQNAGALEAVLAMTLDYAQVRRQFGRPIGKFQAVQHQIAVMAEETAAVRMTVQTAFAGAPLLASPQAAAAAKIRAGQGAVVVSAAAHAVHGAIGMTEEYGLHHHVRRLRRWRLAHGSESAWARALGEWALTKREDFATLARSL
ncbi:MAG: acyl-CoA dehydrogenase family protein [Hyphomonadaceae bacterium]